MHSILFHIFLGVVITLALVYLFDKGTESGGGQAGGRLEPIIVSVIDESRLSQESSEKSNDVPDSDEDKKESRDDSPQAEIITEPEPVELIEEKPAIEIVEAAPKQEKTDNKDREQNAREFDEPESDSETPAQSESGDTVAETKGADSDSLALYETPGELAYNVSESARPDYGLNPKPRYPKSARRRGYEGTVLLRVLVLEDGKVGKIELSGPSGYQVLDESALEAVKKWVFIPGKKAGKEISSWVEVPIKYQLDSG